VIKLNAIECIITKNTSWASYIFLKLIIYRQMKLNVKSSDIELKNFQLIRIKNRFRKNYLNIMQTFV
jgi:hypothetical protein